MRKCIKAVLVQDVTVYSFLFKSGAVVLVDLETMVAYLNGIHFDIFKNEFSVLQ